MFKFLRKGRELNDLAKSFNGFNIMLKEFLQNIEANPSQLHYGDDLLTLAYIATVGINDKMEDYEISMMGKIMIPTIERGFITIAYAYQQTVGKMLLASDLLAMTEEVNEIMDKGALFYTIEKGIPQILKNNI